MVTTMVTAAGGKAPARDARVTEVGAASTGIEKG